MCVILKPMKRLTISSTIDSLNRNFLLLIALLFCTTFEINAQIDQVTLNGNTYWVYPLQKQVISRQESYYQFADRREIIQRDERNEKIISVRDTIIGKTEKENAFQFKGKERKYRKQISELLEKYPSFMVSAENELNTDPTPALVPLPDGKYVQYYRDIPYIQDRVLRYRNDIVAGYFEIKNNVLNGKSTWFNPDGTVVREGNYLNGEKDGPWKHNKYTESADFKFNPAWSLEENIAHIVYDTTQTIAHYTFGLKNGPYQIKYRGRTLVSGNYTQDEENGNWKIYNFKKQAFDEEGATYFRSLDTLILVEQFTYRSDSLRGKSPIMLHEIVHPDYQYSDRDSLSLNNFFPATENYRQMGYSYGNQDYFNFDDFYTVEQAQELLEMQEETVTSYEGELYTDEYDFPVDFMNPRLDNPEEYYQYIKGKRYTLNDLIDSIGYLMRYEGVYEKYYSNGQLQFTCTVTNGTLTQQSPVYWDNGQVACQIELIADSNQYRKRFFDTQGICYSEVWYDMSGNALEPATDSREVKIIEGLPYEINAFQPTYLYVNYNPISDSATEPVLVTRELYKVNLALAKEVVYNPQNRTLVTTAWNLPGDTVISSETVFSEDRETVYNKERTTLGRISLEEIQNGNKYPLFEQLYLNMNDETPPVLLWRSIYNLDFDQTILLDGVPYTGSFSMQKECKRFFVKTNLNSIQIGIPTAKKDLKIYHKQVNDFLEKKKTSAALAYYTPDFLHSNHLTEAVTYLFPNVFGMSFGDYSIPAYGFSKGENPYEFEEVYPSKINPYTDIYRVKGSYLDGKPNGKWTYTNKKGKVLFVENYLKGSLHGNSEKYTYAYSAKNNPDSYDEYYEDPASYYDTTPKKTRHYLAESHHYKNNMLDGEELFFNWLGDTLLRTFYKENAKEGPFFERNPYFYTHGYFKNDLLDGIVQTYMTPPNKDSILLYDLNFRDGLLQGQSKAYHSNGKLAKRGFFLMGQPIDDYEAYDTLGFRYQYVKFQYNQPIEEKIWEENQLSVRYEFDWRDSVSFDFTDITSATSVDLLLYQMGYGTEEMYQPYQGRPSLTYKGGIDYYVTKYYPNDTIARKGLISKGRKTGCWYYYNFRGKKLMEADYFDTILVVNDSIKFKAKGILSYVDNNDQVTSKSWIIEKVEKYDCAHTDHTEERMLYCFWQKDSSQNRINGYVKNYYDNGNLQNEGWVKDGLPTGVWKMYDVNGNLSQVGSYQLGKRTGRWLQGDLGSVRNMSEICLNPNLENLEEILSYQEKLLDVSVVLYNMGKVLKRTYYGINMNSGEAPYGGEEYMIDGY